MKHSLLILELVAETTPLYILIMEEIILMELCFGELEVAILVH